MTSKGHRPPVCLNNGQSASEHRELFEACRDGDLSRVKKLVNASNVNARDISGRKSTALHFAAGNFAIISHISAIIIIITIV